MIRTFFAALTLSFACAAPALAAEGGFPLERAPQRQSDMAALQNGAKIFVNHCLNCHSARPMRYSKLTELGLTDEQIKDNLLFTADKVGDMMNVAMRPDDARRWLGTAPPDLSVIARAKSVNAGPSGADYIYTYLRTYYRDASRATGWNNLAYPNVGMPHVLWAEQGPRELTTVAMHAVRGKDGQPGGWERVTTVHDAQGYAKVTREPVAAYGGEATVEHRFKSLDASRTSAYERDVADLTAFMSWMSEPVQAQRKRLGVYVLIFLAIFFVVAWRLNASFWKHVR